MSQRYSCFKTSKESKQVLFLDMIIGLRLIARDHNSEIGYERPLSHEKNDESYLVVLNALCHVLVSALSGHIRG